MLRRCLTVAALALSPALFGQSKLQVQEPVFQQFEDGPPLPSSSYFDGERVFLTCHVTGFKADKDMQVKLEWKIEARDESGLLLAPAESKTIEVELAPQDKDWRPKLQWQFEAPQTASCKACRVVIHVRDLIAGAEAKREAPFQLRSKSVEPSDKLVVRNVRFLRSDEDANPLAIAAYRPGDEVWARFEMTGFKLGEKNRVQVEYGLTVYRPSGKLLYQEPKAAAGDEASFYPRKWMPGILSLKLDSKMPPGEYPIVLEVRDLAGGQKHEERFTFRIE